MSSYKHTLALLEEGQRDFFVKAVTTDGHLLLRQPDNSWNFHHRKSGLLNLLGAPGEGKGTLGDNIRHLTGYDILEGNHLADELRSDPSAVSQRENGGLIDDKAIINLYGARLPALLDSIITGKRKGNIHIGIPRTGVQADALKELGAYFDAGVYLASDDYTPRIRQLQRAVDSLLETGERRKDADKVDTRMESHNKNIGVLLEKLPNISGKFFNLDAFHPPLVVAYDFFVKMAGKPHSPSETDYHDRIRRLLTHYHDEIVGLNNEHKKKVSGYWPAVKSDVEKFESQIKRLEQERAQRN